MRFSDWISAVSLIAFLAACGGENSASASTDGGTDGGNDRSSTLGGRQTDSRWGDPSSAAAESAGSAAAAGDANTPRAGNRPIVLFIGTSLTAGYGLDDPERQAYPVVVGELADSAELPIEVINAGVSGETSSGALQRMDWLLRQPVDVVVLETGANDGLRGLPVNALRKNIRTIIQRIQTAKPDVPILLLSMQLPPNLGRAYTQSFERVYRDVAKETGVHLGPFLLDRVGGVASLNQGDGIHPNAAGAKILAGTVWKSLEPIILQGYTESSLAPSDSVADSSAKAATKP